MMTGSKAGNSERAKVLKNRANHMRSAMSSLKSPTFADEDARAYYGATENSPALELAYTSHMAKLGRDALSGKYLKHSCDVFWDYSKSTLYTSLNTIKMEDDGHGGIRQKDEEQVLTQVKFRKAEGNRTETCQIVREATKVFDEGLTFADGTKDRLWEQSETWSSEAEELYDQLSAQGYVDPTTGALSGRASVDWETPESPGVGDLILRFCDPATDGSATSGIEGGDLCLKYNGFQLTLYDPA